MTVESVRRVTGRWPSTGNAVDPAGSSIPTLADIEAAFTAWITEARARGCPDTAPAGPVHLYGPDVYGLAVQWDAADDIPTTPCPWADQHTHWARTRLTAGDHTTDGDTTGTLVTCTTCRDGLLLDPDEQQPGPAPVDLVVHLADGRSDEDITGCCGAPIDAVGGMFTANRDRVTCAAGQPADDAPSDHSISPWAILGHLLTAVASGHFAAGVVPDIGPSITVPADADPDQPVTITLTQGADGPPYLTIRRASRDAAPTTPDAGSPPPAVVHVRCDNPACPHPADTTVTLPELAPGVLGHPTLRCGTCGWHLTQGDAAPRVIARTLGTTPDSTAMPPDDTGPKDAPR